MYERDAILEELRTSVVEILFDKVNGVERKMRATLRPDLLPVKDREKNIEEETSYHKTNTDVLAVWDVQVGGWRSFRIESVKYAQVIDSY